MSELLKRLTKSFGDAEYAHAYMEGHLITRLAAQIFALRRERGWTQKELAARAGIAQERVSKIESGDFESLTMKSLKKFARAFDTHLEIALAPFSQGILDVANLSRDKLFVPTRTDDLASFAKMNIAMTGGGMLVAFPDVSGDTVVSLTRSSVSKVLPDANWKSIGHAEVPKFEVAR